jgi:hypothetical protein
MAMTLEDRNAIDRLGAKLDHVAEIIFAKVDEVREDVSSLDKKFAVHVKGSEVETAEVAKLRCDLADLVPKVDKLWSIDQIKLWIMRTIVIGAAGAIGYGISHVFGWH